ncbi:Hypothetical protein POVN_LOCUS283 [uncultured virus]|nr:Hypothetical protein POVN_LOCUS283 [uncultured virus]
MTQRQPKPVRIGIILSPGEKLGGRVSETTTFEGIYKVACLDGFNLGAYLEYTKVRDPDTQEWFTVGGATTLKELIVMMRYDTSRGDIMLQFVTTNKPPRAIFGPAFFQLPIAAQGATSPRHRVVPSPLPPPAPPPIRPAPPPIRPAPMPQFPMYVPPMPQFPMYVPPVVFHPLLPPLAVFHSPPLLPYVPPPQTTPLPQAMRVQVPLPLPVMSPKSKLRAAAPAFVTESAP